MGNKGAVDCRGSREYRMETKRRMERLGKKAGKKQRMGRSTS